MAINAVDAFLKYFIGKVIQKFIQYKYTVSFTLKTHEYKYFVVLHLLTLNTNHKIPNIQQHIQQKTYTATYTVIGY